MSRKPAPPSSRTATATGDQAREAAPRAWLGTPTRRVVFALGVVLAVVMFVFSPDAWLSIIDVALITALGTIALNVLSGYTGQVSLGIAFFMGIGAYTAAVLGGTVANYAGAPMGYNLSFVIWLPAAGVVAAIFGAIIGPTALRLKGFYLGIVTLALVIIGQYLFSNLKTYTGGPQGRAVPAPMIGDLSFASPVPEFGWLLTKNQLYYVLLLVILVLVGLFVANIARTRVGRAWQAVRDNEVAASIMGVNLLTAKTGAFVLSSFLAGIAGALFASYNSYTTFDEWGLVLSIQFIAAMLIGGAASVWGSILGAAFVFALPTALNTFVLQDQSASTGPNLAGNIPALIYGLLIIVFLVFEPAGLIGLIRRLQVFVRRAGQPRKGGESHTPPGESDAPDIPHTAIQTLPHGGASAQPGE